MKFLKNLDYTQVQDDNWRFYRDIVLNSKNYSNRGQQSRELISFSAMRYHVLWGEQIVVDKQVSDDLAQTDLEEITFKELPILHDSLEFYFDDPQLGTFFLNTAEPEKLADAIDIYYKRRELDLYKKIIFNYQTEDNLYAHIIRATGNLTKASLLNVNSHLEDVYDMLFLCFKVLIYASIPKLKPKQIGKKELRFGGKPKVKGRPHLPINRVVYLPREQIIDGQGMTERTGKKYNFYGRRGFMRTYKHERYTKMRGKIQYMPPIPPKDEKPKTTYKVVNA